MLSESQISALCPYPNAMDRQSYQQKQGYTLVEWDFYNPGGHWFITHLYDNDANLIAENKEALKLWKEID